MNLKKQGLDRQDLMTDSTFSGIDIGSLTKLSKLIAQIKQHRSTVSDLNWTVEYPSNLQTTAIHKGQRNGLVVWEESHDAREGISRIQLQDDQGKKLVVVYGSGVVELYQPDSDYFNFSECTYRIQYGLAVDFPEFFKHHFERIESAVSRLSNEAKFYFNDTGESIYVVMDCPLVSSVKEALASRHLIDAMKSEAEKIVNEFKKDHFFGLQVNTWELYIYTKSSEKADSYFEKLDAQRILQEYIPTPKQHTLQVLKQGSVVHLKLHQHIENSGVDYIETLKKIYQSIFKDESAKIFDRKDKIKPVELG